MKRLLIVLVYSLPLLACETTQNALSTVDQKIQSASVSVHESATQLKRVLASMDEQRYVPGIPDMPVHKGFKPMGDENAVYDVVEGRIVDITYVSDITDYETVQDFYQTTLQQLGWQPATDLNTYARDGETLLLEINRDGQTVTLHIALQPADKQSAPYTPQ